MGEEGRGERGGEGRKDGKGSKGRVDRRGREKVHNLTKTTLPPVIRWLVTGL